jgi:acyl-CoA synthetase (NDP forming)
LTAIPGELNLVVIVVPADAVPEIMEDAAVKELRVLSLSARASARLENASLKRKL